MTTTMLSWVIYIADVAQGLNALLYFCAATAFIGTVAMTIGGAVANDFKDIFRQLVLKELRALVGEPSGGSKK